MKKRILVLPLAAMLLAGCGETPSPQPKPDEPTPGPVVPTKTLTGIEVANQPLKVNYKEGETFNPAGMVVNAVYDDGTKEAVTNYQVSNQALTLGMTSITISYEGKTASITITVSPNDPAKKNFDGVSFENKIVTYTGSVYTLEVVGAPDFASVIYTGKDNYIDAGTYPMTAKVSADGYNDLLLSATLTINKANFTGITFASKTVTYDGNSYTIDASGVPSDANLVYTGKDNYVNAGSYPMTATITKNGYNDLFLSATLTINKANFSGITFESNTVSYDGEAHTLEVSGLPSGATVTYTGKDNYVNAGTYPMTATIKKANYNDLVLNATLTINKATLTGVEFVGNSFEYDGNPHSIAITGTLPETATVTYSSDVEGITNTAVEPGKYTITATIKVPNFNDLVLTAELAITTKDVERKMVVSGNTLFFQNAKDENKLYLYNPTNGIVKVSNDQVSDLISIGDSKIMFVSKSVLSSTIKVATYNEGTNKVTLSSIYATSAEYIQSADGEIVYYVKNALTNEKSGIFKADFSGDEAVVTCLSVGKADYLTKLGSKLYFADGLNGKKLSYINLSDQNQARTLLVDEKIKCLATDGTSLYYTVDNLLGNYIAKCNTSGTQRKLTSDQGTNFSFSGDYIYYVNTDKLNSYIYGKGIYRVSKTSVVDNNNPGDLVYEAGEEGLTSLYISSGTIFYYDLDDYKLMCDDGVEAVDVLEEFVKPADPAPLSTGSKVVTHNNLVYYLDLYDEKTLHSYNPQTKANIRLTSDKVKDFAFIGDYIYFNMASRIVDNNLYRINLKVGGEPELVNNYDATAMCSDGNYLYYSEENAVGAKTAVHKCDLDGNNDVIIFDEGVNDLTLFEGNLYFYKRAKLYNYLYCIEAPQNLTSAVEATEIVKCTGVVASDKLYIISEDNLCEFNTTSKTTTILIEDPKINYLKAYNNGILYYSDTNKTASEGLYFYDSAKETSSLLLLCNSTYYPSAFDYYGDDIYFVNCQGDGLFGESSFYVLEDGEPVKIA